MIKSACMVIEYFAAMVANMSSCFLSTTYVRSISSNIALVSKTIELAVFVGQATSKNCGFEPHFPIYKNMMLKYIISIKYKLTIQLSIFTHLEESFT